MRLDIKKLETERLSFKYLEESDAEVIFAYRTDVNINRYLNWKPQDIQEVKEFIDSNIKSIDDPSSNWFNLSILLKTDNSMIGDIGFFFYDTEKQQLEIGCTISSNYQGKGYAEEALKAIIDYSFRILNIHRIIASTDPRNINSVKLFEKVGMRLEAHHKENMKLDDEWIDTQIFAILEKEYLK